MIQMCYQLSNHSCSLSWGHYRQFNCPYRPLQSPWPVLTQITQQWPLSCETYFLPFGKRLSFGGKSNRGKKPLPKRAKKDVLHKDVVLLPSPDARLVLTHQMQWLMENSGFSYMPSQLTSLCKRKISGLKSELLERQISIHEVLLRMNSITKVSHGHGLYFTAFNQISIRKWYLYRPLPWHWHSSPRFKSIGWSLKLKLTSWWEM